MSVLLSYPFAVTKYLDKNILEEKEFILAHNSCLQTFISGNWRWQKLDTSSHVTFTLKSREGLRACILFCAHPPVYTYEVPYFLPGECCCLHCVGLPSSTEPRQCLMDIPTGQTNSDSFSLRLAFQ